MRREEEEEGKEFILSFVVWKCYQLNLLSKREKVSGGVNSLWLTVCRGTETTPKDYDDGDNQFASSSFKGVGQQKEVNKGIQISNEFLLWPCFFASRGETHTNKVVVRLILASSSSDLSCVSTVSVFFFVCALNGPKVALAFPLAKIFPLLLLKMATANKKEWETENSHFFWERER